MDRDIPNYNPLVNGKIQHKNMQLHYQRLHSIKVQFCQMQSTLPSRSALRPSRHKASTPAQLHQEERKTAIEKDNVLLFNKMMHIMKRPDPCNQPTLPPARPHRPSAELTRIQEQNRSSLVPSQPCTNASRGRNPLSTTARCRMTGRRTRISSSFWGSTRPTPNRTCSLPV